MRVLVWGLAGLLTVFLASVATAEEAAEGALLLRVAHMDCAGCEPKINSTLGALPFVDDSAVRFAGTDSSPVCVSLSGPADSEALTAALDQAGYELLSSTRTTQCSRDTLPAAPGIWEALGAGRDVQRISSGEQVDLTSHLRADGYTVIDVGAPWCGPCHTAAERLAA